MWHVNGPCKRAVALLAVSFLVTVATAKHDSVFAGSGGACFPVYPCGSVCAPPPCGPSYYRAGDLQVFVVGKKKNRLEIFFKDNFGEIDLEEAAWLNCRNQISLAPASEWGACAVRYGKKLSRFVLCGWEKSGELSHRSHVYYSDKDGLDIDERHAVRFKWITARILRVMHGQGGRQYCILKYVGGDSDQWKVLYQTPQDKAAAAISSVRGFVQYLW